MAMLSFLQYTAHFCAASTEFVLTIPPHKLAGPAARRYVLTLLLALFALLALVKPDHNGDFIEYTLVASALASHGTPDVRLDDIADLKRMVPDKAWAYELLEKDMVAGKPDVYAAFERGRGGNV